MSLDKAIESLQSMIGDRGEVFQYKSVGNYVFDHAFDKAATHASSKTQIFGMSEDFLIELHGLMEIADIKEEDVLKAMRNIAKVKREEVPF